MQSCILALDVGGTYIKHALMLEGGIPAEGTVAQAATGASLPMEAALAAFQAVVRTARLQAETHNLNIKGVAIAFPGPFDYDRGIPKMEHKFQSLYGISLTPVVQAVLPSVPVAYLHDSTAFLLGEAVYGAARGALNPAGIMLGTGLGFASMRDGRVCVQADQRPAVRLWNRPYGGGIVEDALSARGIVTAYAARTGETRSAKDVAELAFAGHATALAVYREMGERIHEILGPVLEKLGCGMLVLGGQVSRSAPLFLPEIRLNIPVVIAADLDAAALKGACAYDQLGRANTVQVVESL